MKIVYNLILPQHNAGGVTEDICEQISEICFEEINDLLLDGAPLFFNKIFCLAVIDVLRKLNETSGEFVE